MLFRSSYPFFREGRVGANFVVRSPDAALVDQCLADLTRDLAAAGHEVTQGGFSQIAPLPPFMLSLTKHGRTEHALRQAQGERGYAKGLTTRRRC